MTYSHNLDNATVTICSSCKDGFYLSNSTCTKIEVDFCKVGSSITECTNCLDGYIIFNDNGTKTCQLPHDYMTEECETVDNTGSTNKLNQVTCSNCKINSLPIDYENNYVCVRDDYLKDKDTLNITTKINFCIKYEENSGTVFCTMCEKGKFLKHDYTECLDNCGSNPFSPMIVNNDPFYIRYYNVCVTDTAANYNTEIFGIDKADMSSQTQFPIKCNANKVTVIEDIADTIVSSNISLDGTFENYVQDIGTTSPTVACPVAAVTQINAVGNTDLVSNCQYYNQVSAGVHGCVKCKHGYHGKGNSATGTYIQDCNTKMGSCDSPEYKNLSGNLAAYFSCHKCIDSNRIPYFIYTADAGAGSEITNLRTFGLSGSAQWNDGTDGHTIECLNTSSWANFLTSIGGTTSDTTTALIANCGLGLLDLTNDKNATAVILHKCAACKPGYLPDDVSTITSCTKIANCVDNSKWFNACSSCKTGYVFKVVDGAITYTECVSQADSGCLATTGNNLNCTFCKKGFFLNLDGVCVTINTPKCQTGKYTPYASSVAGITCPGHPSCPPVVPRIADNISMDFSLISSNVLNSGYILWFNEQGSGCNQCNSGYIAIKQNTSYFSKKSCAASAFVQANSNNFPNQKTGNNTLSKYIDNCESYVIDSNTATAPKCSKCNANWVIKEDGSKCVKLENCEKASNSGNQCLKCKIGFGLVANLCQAGAISNCETYNRENNDTTKVNCTKCNQGFYKTNKSICEEGNVANCLEHKDGTPNECNICKSDYFLVTKNLLSSSTTHDYCYKMDSTLNCKETLIQNSEIGAKFTCTKCSQLFAVKEIPLSTGNQTSCLPYNIIPNCKTYNTNSSLANSSLLCSLCNNGYYISNDGSKCVKRTINPVGCKNYENNLDLCSTCNEGNFLSSDKKSCIVFPVGKIGCSEYSDTNTCTSCGADSWLDEGKCTPVVTEAKVTNCLYYSNSTTCSECQPGNFLEGNVCVVLNVSNCLKVASKNACESCLPGYALKVVQTNTSSTTNCESFSKPSCVIFDQSGENPCIQCNQNFYISSTGDCVAVTNNIAQCLINETIDTCKTCVKGYALSVDKKSCVNASVYDSNCNEVVMPENMSCSRCNPGYYFKDSQCVAFKGKSFSSGCFSEGLDDEKICLLCNTGYYMNSSLNCVKIDTTPVDPTDPTDPDSNDVRVVRCLVAMVISFVFLF